MRGSVLAACLLIAAPVLARDTIRFGNDVSIQSDLDLEEAAVWLFMLPFALANELPHRGFERYPYDAGAGYGHGKRNWAAELRTSGQALSGGGGAFHARVRMRSSNRVGWDFKFSDYDAGIWTPKRTRLFAGHITANYLQSGWALVELGIGGGVMGAAGPRTGVDAELAAELFPARPAHLGLRYEALVLGNTVWSEAAGAVGLSWRRLGLSIGYRSLWGPPGIAHGPELALRLWF